MHGSEKGTRERAGNCDIISFILERGQLGRGFDLGFGDLARKLGELGWTAG